MPESNQHDLQPIDAIMHKWNLENHDLVKVSLEQLTHKQVQKARSGRQLTLKLMMKVARALNVAIWQRLDAEQKERFVEYNHKHLFNYAKDPIDIDPNAEL